MTLLHKIPKRVFTKVSADYDVSLLIKALVLSSLENESLFTSTAKLIKNLKLNLRCQFMVLSAILNNIIENENS